MATWITDDGCHKVETLNTALGQHVRVDEWTGDDWHTVAMIRPPCVSQGVLGAWLIRELSKHFDPATLVELPGDDDTAWLDDAASWHA